MKLATCKNGHINRVIEYKAMCPECGAPFVEVKKIPLCKHHSIPMEMDLAMNVYDPEVGMTLKTFETFECPTCLKAVKRWLDEHNLKATEVRTDG